MKIAYLILSLLMPTCEYEDQSNCHWDASTNGNGTGQSFVQMMDVTIYEIN